MTERPDLDAVVDGLMARIDEIAEEMRGGGAPTYPPGIDPERMRALHRAGLREVLASEWEQNT